MSCQKGQIALTTVFLIGSFIIIMALTLAFLSVSIVVSGRSVQSANQALFVASAGAEDAILKIVRDNTLSGSFALNVGGKIATVNISVITDGRVVITSSSTVNSSQKTVQAIISIVSSTGQVSVVSMQQI